ncbi:MAG: arsenic resistance protein, partial [Acidimicrobiales bacterium]
GGRNWKGIGERAHLPYLKTGALVVVVVAMFASQADELFDEPGVFVRLAAPIGVFFAVAFAIAVLTGRLLDLPYDQTALLAFTTTSRNSEASLAIAATAFASPLVAAAVVIGPVLELPLLVLMVRVLVGLRHRGYRSSVMTTSASVGSSIGP